MKWTQSLIRISEHQIDELRKRVRDIAERRAECERRLMELAVEAAAEAEQARASVEAGWYLIGYREGWKARKDKVLAQLDALRLEEEGVRDALAVAFEELKKVEQVADAARAAKGRAEAKIENANLDELALRARGGR